MAGAIGAALPNLPRRLQTTLRSPGGDAVRHFIALRHHPYGSAGIDDLRRLRGSMPRLLAAAGLGDADAAHAGDTAIASETTRLAARDFIVVGAAETIVNLLLLGLFLRSLIAPFLIVATSLLGIAATLGLTVLFFRALDGTPDLTYYVPLAVDVLLPSLGTDYNLFVVGRIWQEAGRRDVASAIRLTVPAAGRAISITALAPNGLRVSRGKPCAP